MSKTGLQSREQEPRAGPEIAVIDLASGKVVAHVRLKPQ